MKNTPQAIQTELPYPKLCECGCGQPAPISMYTNKNRGIARGKVLRFVRGHSRRLTPEKQFWNHVSPGLSTECWEWQGSTITGGYGNINLNKLGAVAHRLSWELHFGPIPDGLWVLHRCDNPPCVNPAHLFLGTVKDNVDDMMAKGRHAKLKGELNPRAKVTEADVSAIRQLASEGQAQRTLARKYGVSDSIISNIVLRKTWAHIP